MLRVLAAALLALALVGCKEEPNRDGYTPLTINLISGAPAAASISGGCLIYTDIPTDTRNPDQHGEALRHIGKSAYECLTGTSSNVVGDTQDQPFYSERLWFKIDGSCPNSYYGCFRDPQRTIDTNLYNIGAGCPVGTAAWDEQCWTQFYTVLGHEIMHGWLGAFHP